MRAHRPGATAAGLVFLAGSVLATSSGCVFCPAIAYGGEVRIEAPSGALRDAAGLTIEVCADDCAEPWSVELRRVSRDVFVPADCTEPADCSDHRIEPDGRLTMTGAPENADAVDYELTVVYADGRTRTESGQARIESRKAGDVPCRQEVADAVIDLG